MKLSQNAAFRNFYQTQDNKGFLVYASDTSRPEFDMSKAFTEYTFRYLLLFFKDALPLSDGLRQNLQHFLDGIGNNSKILWVDKLGETDVNVSFGITIDATKKNICTEHLIFNRGVDLNKVFIRTLDDNDNNLTTTVRFDEVAGLLSFVVNGGNVFKLIANDGQENSFDSWVIPLQHQSTLLGLASKASGNNVGAVCFRIMQQTHQAIQPKTSLVSPRTPNKNGLFSYHYFDDESYSRNGTVLALLYPSLSSNNHVDGFSSYLELFVNDHIKTNFIDELGNHFLTPKGSSLISRLTFTNFNEQTENKRNFFFIPQAGESLDLTAGGNFLLLGNSGTERADKTKLVFRELEEVLIREKEDGSVEHIPYAGSRTSITVAPAATVLNYYIDAEKKSLFDNNASSLQTDGKSLQVSYRPIQAGAVDGSKALPIIPTLTFRQNESLQDLEKLLVRSRIGGFVKEPAGAAALDGDKNFVTPQGFLRSGQRLDFINPSAGMGLDGSPVQFKVEGVTMTSDFHLSLSKEDVFFVLKPSMMKNPEKAGISFNIRDFKIELNEFNHFPTDPSQAKDDTFILFKFSRYSLQELLADPSKWSNYGKYKPSQTDAAALAGAVLDKMNFPDTEDYKYFNESIRNDRNWNGVVVLNIPIDSGALLPDVIKGLAGSQDLQESKDTAGDGERLKLQTGMRFQYVAFPVNKTAISGGAVAISSTSFYGIIDYDILNKPDGSPSVDYPTVSGHFPKKKEDIKTYKFILTKLLVRFENTAIRNFQSFAFLQIPDIFDNKVGFGPLSLSHPGKPGDSKLNLIRLEGQYQRNSAGNDEFLFSAQAGLKIGFDEGVLRDITVSKVSFSYSAGTKEFMFGLDAGADLSSWSIPDLISIEKIDFQNIGFKFSLDGIKLPRLSFDLSKLLVFPKINFNGKGFLSSFPIRFSHFQIFQFKRAADGLDFVNGDFDFFKLPGMKLPNISIGDPGNLFSFIFDFDLGTLGDLEALKFLKGQLLMGWSLKGGFSLGFKLDGPSSDGLHLNLFGALKIDITEVSYGTFMPEGAASCEAYFLRLKDARLTIFGKELPGEKKSFNGIIIADFSKTAGPSHAAKKIAWLINYDDQETGKLVLGAGQRMGPPLDQVNTTVEAIKNTRDTFKLKLKDIDACADPHFTDKINFRPERNWLLASEAILPDDWPLELKFIFNDPVLYGIYLGFKSDFLRGFSIDILYKKLSANLGVYSTDIRLPDAIRNYELGGAFIKLPNIGVEIYTNGDWKVDVGFPKNSNDWSRSGFIQLRTTPPFVGFFGTYMMASKVASLTLFKGYIDDGYSTAHLKIIQAGFALRVGLGFYLDKGILYVGASITIYAILEGAFAFEKQTGLTQLFPDHFALLGRFGALAELVGYVDFAIIKASVYISLRAEFGLLLVYIGRDGIPGHNAGKGIQPVIMYIEGEVRVEVSIKIGCVKIHLGFHMSLRFEYTIGGGGSGSGALMGFTGLRLPSALLPATVPVVPVSISDIKDIPMAYLPAFSKIREGGVEKLVMIHSFMIPFFGKSMDGDKIIFSDTNIFKDRIIKPFFSNLLKQLSDNGIDDPDRYETLRAVLLNGACRQHGTDVRVHISVTGYLPTFIKGLNATDKPTVDAVLLHHFGFTAGELKPEGTDNSIVGGYGAELLVIPAPIAKKIQIADATNNILHTSSPDGFKVKVAALVNDGEGNPPGETFIGAVRDFDDDTLQWMEAFYDAYKTQFVHRAAQQLQAPGLTNKDMREEIVIPEFFKLAALLTLEAFYHSTNPREKNAVPYNPRIGMRDDGHFMYDTGKDWNPNAAIEQVAGQLNYFYNSGLRLPFEKEKDPTKAIYELLLQQQAITPIPPAARDLGAIQVLIDDQDLTREVFAGDEAKRQMLLFIDGFGGDFSLDNLKNEFTGGNPVLFTRPFDLVPVTLAVQNGRTGEKDVCRFFDIPAKLSQYSNQEVRYAFELNYARYDKDVIELSSNKPPLPALSFTKCLNVEIKVRKQTARVLEIVNVMAKDLQLMNALYNDSYDIGSIDMYYKQEADASDPSATIGVSRIIDTFATIWKTNLSPRTSPPLFDTDGVQLLDGLDGGREYFDDSNNPRKKNFIRLVWEALTTNNGGYYLILDKDLTLPKDASGKEIVNATLLLSFVGDQPVMPAYFNAIKLPAGPVLAGLDDRSHYLFIDGLRISNSMTPEKAVLEYHPRIPAHTMGFEIERDRSKNTKANYQNYIPLEFVLDKMDGNGVLSAERVLPILPTSDNEQLLRYKHLSPLVIQDKAADPAGKNIDRYSAAGKKYKLGVNLRDVFGARTNMPGTYLATTDYEHFYFDRLLPVDTWPLIKFSYWIAGKTGSKLAFTLSCQCDIREVLDLAGIKRRYALDEEINGSNVGGGPTDIERLQGLIPGMLQNLYTILAQLTDVNTKAFINGVAVPDEIKKWRDMVTDLADKLTGILTPRDGKFFMPAGNVKAVDDLPIEIDMGGDLKKALAIVIRLARDGHFIHEANDSVYKKNAGDPSLSELTSANIWDYDMTRQAASPVKFFNPSPDAKDKSHLKDLNEAVRSKTANQFCLGISAEWQTVAGTGQRLDEKVIYIINEENLSSLHLDNVNAQMEISQDCYFGIRPVSNRLWSGDYTPSLPGATTNSFSNTDLDKSLKIVLEKIDQLMQARVLPGADGHAGAVPDELKALYNQLIGAKKALVENRLKQYLAWVMDKAHQPLPGEGLTRAFRDLLLDALTNFYIYDGIIKTTVSGLEVLEGTHRATLDLAPLDDSPTARQYNLAAAKMNPDSKEWYVLFDQREGVMDSINFDVQPRITHLEFDIRKQATSEIEQSTWIQLINPVVFTNNKYSVKGWPRITREFPDKPVVTTHSAGQAYHDGDKEIGVWDIDKAGLWNYQLGVKDTYVSGDIIHVDLVVGTSGGAIGFTGQVSTFEGFIAYWASRISDARTAPGGFDPLLKDFISDLSAMTGDGAAALRDEMGGESRYYSFELHKSGTEWLIGKVSEGITVDYARKDAGGQPDKTLPSVIVGPFNLFDKTNRNRASLVLPKLKVFRNRDVQNEIFIYETDTVTPPSPATPHIRYFSPMALRTGGSWGSDVFGTAARPVIPQELALKATAKYLVDTAGKDGQNNDRFPGVVKTLPVIPVQQIECGSGARPDTTDELFRDFDRNNGYQGFSLTVYNDTHSEDDLPLFYIDVLFKQK